MILTNKNLLVRVNNIAISSLDAQQQFIIFAFFYLGVVPIAKEPSRKQLRRSMIASPVALSSNGVDVSASQKRKASGAAILSNVVR